jgi:broad specificity phosphatase PhoE
MQVSDSPKLWFIRHAESEANVRRIYDNGESALGLTSHGLEQAKAIARSFSEMAGQF